MTVEKLYDAIVEDTAMWRSPLHGTSHWIRVRKNGLSVASQTGGDCEVVEYFSILHDCMRWNEGIDPEHGSRAAVYAREKRHLIDLSEDQFVLLVRACAGHTHAKPGCDAGKDPTLAACWDGDRLDIGRVGVTVDPRYLFSDYARTRVIESKKIGEDYHE